MFNDSRTALHENAQINFPNCENALMIGTPSFPQSVCANPEIYGYQFYTSARHVDNSAWLCTHAVRTKHFHKVLIVSYL